MSRGSRRSGFDRVAPPAAAPDGRALRHGHEPATLAAGSFLRAALGRPALRPGPGRSPQRGGLCGLGALCGCPAWVPRSVWSRRFRSSGSAAVNSTRRRVTGWVNARRAACSAWRPNSGSCASSRGRPNRYCRSPTSACPREPACTRIWFRFPVTQRHLDQRLEVELLDDPVARLGVPGALLVGVGALLDQPLLVPDEAVAPRPARRNRPAVDNREIRPLGRVPLELRLQHVARGRSQREQHQPARIAVDAVHDQRPWPAPATQMVRQQIAQRHFAGLLARERLDQPSRRLVHHDDRLVLVTRRPATARADTMSRRRGRELPGRSGQKPTWSPAASRRPASSNVTSASFRYTLPHAIASRAFPREPISGLRGQPGVEPLAGGVCATIQGRSGFL